MWEGSAHERDPDDAGQHSASHRLRPNPFWRGSLIADSNGDLFGTAKNGASFGAGTAFEIARTSTGYASAPTTLVSFDGANGATPRPARPPAEASSWRAIELKGGGAPCLRMSFFLLAIQRAAKMICGRRTAPQPEHLNWPATITWVRSGLQPNDLTVYNGERSYSRPVDASANCLWVTDGTAAGSALPVGAARPSRPDRYSSKALSAARPTAGLWVTDGTAAGTNELTGSARGRAPVT